MKSKLLLGLVVATLAVPALADRGERWERADRWERDDVRVIVVDHDEDVIIKRRAPRVVHVVEERPVVVRERVVVREPYPEYEPAPVYDRGPAPGPYYRSGYGYPCSPGLGNVIGAVTGGLLGSTVGRGNGRIVAAGIGAATGAVVGGHIACR